MRLNPIELDQLKDKLEDRRRMLLEQRSINENARLELRAEQAEPEEMARNQDERRVLASLNEKETEELGLVDGALQRIELGEFGRCRDCGREISKIRLMALPWARYCGSCADNSVKEQRTSSPEEWTGKNELPPDFSGMDDDARARVLREAFRDMSELPMDSVDVSFDDGVPRISGMVPGFQAKETIRHVLQDTLGFRDYLDDTRVERPVVPPNKAGRNISQGKTGSEELLQGEDVNTDPHESLSEGEPLSPPDRMRREE